MNLGLEPSWGPSWAWGMLLIAITIAMHAMGVVLITVMLMRLRARLSRRGRRVPHPITLAVVLVCIVGVLLALLHGIEAVVWAAAYVWLHAIDAWPDAMLYSFDSITTRGATDLVLHRHWQLMGALEAADGMLLFGISTAFVFAMIERVMPMIITPEGHRRDQL